MKKTLLSILAAAVAAGPATPADPPGKGDKKSVQSEHKLKAKVTTTDRRTKKPVTKAVEMGYLLYLPEGYEKPKGKSPKRWPLMLFLHGAGERGTDLALVKKHGPPKLVERGKRFPFLIVSPQCPRGQWWNADVLTALLDEVVAAHAVDEDRVYVTGLSMGGFGTWALGAKTPRRFAALVPICGGGDTKTAARLKDIAVWAFHGERDRLVRPERSRQMVKAIQAAGGKNVKLTVYPDAGHNSWTRAYAEPGLYEWLLKQKRSGKAKPAKQPKVLKTRT